MTRLGTLISCASVLVLALCCSQALSHGECSDRGVDVTSTLLDSGTSDTRILWINSTVSRTELGVIFLLTHANSLLRSLDGGKTWSNETERLQEGRVASTIENSIIGAKGGVTDIIPNADKSIVYFTGFDGRVWSTMDGGQTYTLFRPSAVLGDGKSNSPIMSFQAHPFNPLLAAAIVKDVCCYTRCSFCTYKMVYTLDKGDTWKVVVNDHHIAWEDYNYIGSDYPWWGLGPQDAPINSWAMMYLGYRTSSPDYLTAKNAVPYPELIIHRDIRYPLSTPNNEYLRVINVDTYFYDGQAIILNVFNASSLRREVWMATDFPDSGTTVRRIRVPPPPDMADRSRLDEVNFVDFDDGAVWMTPKWYTQARADTSYFDGDLYLDADPTSTARFTWSLRSLNQEAPPGRKDLSKIRSVDGAYIANSLVNRKDPSRWVSQMTWNMGARWDPLRPPANTQCASGANCRLNLLGPYSGSEVKSSSFAPGIIIANGWVSETAGNATRNMPSRTFISTDGGLNWNIVSTSAFPDGEGLSEGSNLYDIAEGGSIIALLDKDTSDHIAWTNTAGLGSNAWASCTYDESGVKKQPIMFMSDPYGASQNILLLTLDTTVPGPTGTGQYELWHFNFSRTIPRNCAPEDYELYRVLSPAVNGSTDDVCIMGRALSYNRKRPEVNCGNAVLTISATYSCACTREDYVCSDCFVPSADGLTCEFVPGCRYLGETEANPPDACPTGTNYTTTETGYDLIAGTQCFRGLSLDRGERILPCPAGRTGLFDQYPWLISPGVIAGAAVGTLFFFLVLVAIGVILGQRCIKNMDLTAMDRHATFKAADSAEELASEARTADDTAESANATHFRPGLDDDEDSNL